MTKEKKPDLLKAKIGARIRSAREFAGFTQAEFARRVGKAQQSVAQWETGVAAPRIESIAKVARLLGITAQQLLESTDEAIEIALGSESSIQTSSEKESDVVAESHVEAGTFNTDGTSPPRYQLFASADGHTYLLDSLSGEVALVTPNGLKELQRGGMQSSGD